MLTTLGLSGGLIFAGRFQFDRILGNLLVLSTLLQLVIEHFLRDGHKHVLDIQIVLGRRLEQFDVHLAGEPARVLRDDHLAVGVVVLVAHQHLIHHITIVLDLL